MVQNENDGSIERNMLKAGDLDTFEIYPERQPHERNYDSTDHRTAAD
jgi:hypothetical protein